jgi:hypothetical protein
MAQEIKLEAKGLYTNPSDLQRPDGALTVATNILIKREGVIESRKGFRNYVTALEGSDAATWVWPYDTGAVFYYDSGYLGHSTVSFDNNTAGAVTNQAITFGVPGTTWAEANGNLYIPAEKGLFKKTSLASGVFRTGAPRGLGADRDDRVATVAIGAMSLTTNVVTATTNAAHGFYVGQVITQTSATEAPYAAGNYVVATVPSATQFTYALTAGDDAGNANAHTFAPAQLETTNGWLADGFQVAYRYVLVVPDANTTEIVGAPSGRSIVANTSAFRGYTASTAANPVVRFRLPAITEYDTTKSITLRVFRSKAVEVAIEPSDEMGLVFQKILTPTEISQNWVDVIDISPDSGRGEALYTNPSQEGLLESNNEAPNLKNLSIAAFDGSRLLLGGETTQQHSLVFTLLAVGGANGIAAGDDINFATGITVRGVTTTPTADWMFKLDTSGTTAQNIRNTALNMVAAINRAGANNVYAYYLSGANESPGKMLVVRAPHTANTELRPSAQGKRGMFYPQFAPYPVTSYNLSRTGSIVTATRFGVDTHNFVAGDKVELTTPSADFGAGPHTITAATTTTFTYTETGAATTSAGNSFRPAYVFVSTDDNQLARVFESKPFQFEAFPPLNYADVGDPTERVLALAVIRNQVFAFKNDGLYLRTAPQTWELFDGTVKLVGARAVCTLLNNIYAWTTQGIVAINDTGVEIISRPIENLLTQPVNSYASAVKQNAFAVANELERTVHFYVPSNASVSVFPAQAYVFNTITRAWTRETVGDTQFLTGATFFSETNKSYRGAFTIGGALYLQRETNSQADYQDIPGNAQTPTSISGSTLNFSGTPPFVALDVLVSDLGNIYIVQGTGVNFVVLDRATAAGEATYALATPINWSWTYAPITAGNPDGLKLFRGINVLFQNAHLRTITVSASTELRTTAVTQSPDMATLAAQWSANWDNIERPYNLSLLVPQEMRRAARLNLNFSQTNRPCQVFAVNGLSIRLSPSGDKVSK